MGNVVIGSCYVLIAFTAVVLEILPSVHTETIWAKLALAGVGFAALVQADKFL